MEFAHRADLTICTTESSATAYWQDSGVRSTSIVHRRNVQLDRCFGDVAVPVEYLGDDRPIIVYVGAAEHRLDVDLMVRGISVEFRQFLLRRSSVPSKAHCVNACMLPGAQLLGSRPHELLAGYLLHAYVGIVPFSFTQCSELIREVSPLKVLEYAACGLPVVGSQGCQYPSDLPTPFAICRSADKFLEAIKAFTVRPKPERPSVEQFSSYSWSARIAPLFEWVETRSNPPRQNVIEPN